MILSTCSLLAQMDAAIVFSGAFGGSTIESNTYTNPTGAEGWAGFANEDFSIYPLSFSENGEISFTGSTVGIEDAEVYFRFEYNPYPDTEPSFSTETVTISGSSEETYLVNIPTQGVNIYSSFLFYVITKDVQVTLTNVNITSSAIIDPCADVICPEGEECIDGECIFIPFSGPSIGAPTPPSRDPANVISIYSDTYANVNIDNFDFGLCGSSSAVAEEMIDGNSTQHYLGEGCQGISLENNRIDASSFTNLHFDFFTDETNVIGKVFNIKLVDWAGNATEAGASGLEINFNDGSNPAIISGSWVSVDVDITSFGALVGGNLTISDIAQIHITSNLSNAWYDNLYLYKDVLLPTTASVEFTVDMNGVDQPSADYDQVTVNGSWNGWNGWGLVLSDEDADGIFTGVLELEAGTSFEYVVAVSGEPDGFSGWGIQWGDGCVGANVLVTAGDVGTVTQTSLTPGCSEILGCMDTNASNFDAAATAQAYDQYGNLGCIFTSCDDIPVFGCIYGDGFGAFNDEFGAEACITYGGTPCTDIVTDVNGCIDPTATNYDATATLDDGSCTYESIALTIITSVCDVATSVSMTGPWWGWDAAAGPVATDNGDGTWSFTFDPAPTENMEYLLVVDGVQENLIAGNTESDDWSCTPVTDYSSYANRMWTAGSGDISNVYGTCGTECPTVDPELTTASVEFTVDMNGVDQPSADYDQVTVNGSWNGWNGWGLVLSDEDADGIFTGVLELEAGTSFEYVVAVSGEPDGFSGWGIQWGDGCVGANVLVTAGDVGTVTQTSLTPGCSEILGCMDTNASNFDAAATAQAYDQYGNLGCIFTSCDDIPVFGCIYGDGFGAFNDEFGAEACITYGGTPCAEIILDAGCIDSNASNFEENAVNQSYDQYGNSTCIYASCDDIPEDGCIYGDGFGAFNDEFGAEACVTYGGIACTTESIGPDVQEVNLAMGWSSFSTYMIPADMNIASILGPVIENIIICKDYLGTAYLPEWNFNGIGDITVGQAYQIKTTDASELSIEGEYAFPEDNPVALGAGWNLIGYLRIEPTDAVSVFFDINATGNLVIAKDYLGSAYLPEWNFNGIGNMLPGAGYQVKTNNADTLQYLSNDDSYKLSSMEIIQNKASYFDRVVPTDNNMTIVIEDAAWSLLPKYGDEIAAYDSLGNLVGSAKYTSPVTVLTVWGNDATTITKDGMSIAEDISFKGLTNGLVVDLNVRKCEVGSSVYSANAIIVVSSIVADVTAMDMHFLEAVPNPSSSITQISFLTSKSSLVNISLYNTLGELVKVITQSTYSKGTHIVSVDVGMLEAGSYFYKMTTDTFSKTKRLSVLK